MRLLADNEKGFGGGDVVSGAAGGAGKPFDPASVSGTCSAGNPEFGKDPGKGINPLRGPVGYSVIAHGKRERTIWEKGWEERIEIHGEISWGGKGQDAKDPATGKVIGKYKGLTEDEAKLEKIENVAAAKKAREGSQKDGGRSERDAAQKKAAREKAETAAKKAQGDPNIAPPNPSRPAGFASACETALQGARETLRECNRNGWKSATCQQINAQMNGCADPTLAYIDPDAGYVCGEKVDPQRVVDAAKARCRELTRPGPDGRDPCEHLNLDEAGWGQGRGGYDVCNDPRAYVDPDGAGCMVEVEIGKTFGEIDIHQVIIIAMDRLGGPLVIIPNNNPPPPGPVGPDPRPGPRFGAGHRQSVGQEIS